MIKRKLMSFIMLWTLASTLIITNIVSFADTSHNVVTNTESNPLVISILDYSNSNNVTFIESAQILGYYSDNEVLVDPSKDQLSDALAVADYIHNESGLPVQIQAINSEEEIDGSGMTSGESLANQFAGPGTGEGATPKMKAQEANFKKILKTGKKMPASHGKTISIQVTGGYSKTTADFKDLGLKNVKNLESDGSLRIGQLANGRVVTIRNSNHSGNGPTLEVVKKSGKFTHLKIRY